MPHRCLQCGTLYADDAQEVLRGCTCGNASFLFVRQSDPMNAPGVSSPRDGSYVVDVAQLLVPQASDDPNPNAVIARAQKDGAYDIDLREALGVDERKD